MKQLRKTYLSLALLSAPLGAAAQSSSDIIIDTPETLEFQVRMSISPGTRQVYCYQQDRLAVVGTVNVASGSTATVPIALADPVIRCTACNTYGCSTLSPNAAIVVPTLPLDLNLNGQIDVSDMLLCVSTIRDQIY